MANVATPPKSTAMLRQYERAGQLELMGDKTPSISDILDDLQSGSGGGSEVVDTAGAITSRSGTVFLTKTSIVAMTLAAPTVAENGKVLTILSTTAFAHTVTCPAGKINGNMAVATFSGAIADNMTVKAYNGVWWTVNRVGVTLT